MGGNTIIAGVTREENLDQYFLRQTKVSNTAAVALCEMVSALSVNDG